MPGVLSQCSQQEFESFWPLWRESEGSGKLLDCRVHCSVEELRDLFFQPNSQFQVKAHEANGNTNFAETQWVTSFERLPSLPGGYTWQSQASVKDSNPATPVPGMMRKVRCTSPGTALHRKPFQTEELQRCRSYIPCQKFTVEVAVVSTPMYCDRFRPLILYTIKAESQRLCRLTIDYQIRYIKTVNFLVRGIVERSARSGMKENFEKSRRVLGTIHHVEDLLSGNEAEQGEKEIRSHRIQDLENEMSDDDVTWTDENRRPIDSGDNDDLSLFSVIVAVLPILYPVHLLFRILKSLLWTGKSWKPGPVDAIEALVRVIACFLLTLTIIYFIHPFLLEMNEACRSPDQMCNLFFTLFVLPQSFHQTICSGMLFLVVLWIVELGLG